MQQIKQAFIPPRCYVSEHDTDSTRTTSDLAYYGSPARYPHRGNITTEGVRYQQQYNKGHNHKHTTDISH